MLQSLQRLVRRIKRAETPVESALKDRLRRLQYLEMPVPEPVADAMLVAYSVQRQLSDEVARRLFFQPIFRARAESVGEGLLLYGGMPYIYGDLRIRMGAFNKLSAQTSLVAGHVFDAPVLETGDDTNIGAFVTISVSRKVTLGNRVSIANGVEIYDNPGHNIHPDERRQPVRPESIHPVAIEDDVWVGSHSTVMPGVTIGAGSVVGARSVVTKDVPPMTFVAGAPTRIIRSIDGENRPSLQEVEHAA